MTNQAAFDGALRLIGETPGEGDLADYTARGPHLVAAACLALAALDRLCRAAFGYAGQVLPPGGEYPLDEDFPLCDELLPAAATHIAAGLLFDENPVLSDRLHNRLGEQTAALIGSLPARVEEIVNRY